MYCNKNITVYPWVCVWEIAWCPMMHFLSAHDFWEYLGQEGARKLYFS